MNLGNSKTVKTAVIAVLDGTPTEEIKNGMTFRCGPQRFRVDTVSGDDANITRIGALEVSADGGESFTDTPTKFEDKERFHELDVFESPQVLTEGPSGGYPPFSKPKTGPVMTPGLPAENKNPAQSIVEKVDVLGPERKSPRPPPLRSTPVNEPTPDDRRWSSMAVRVMNAIDPDYRPSEETS